GAVPPRVDRDRRVVADEPRLIRAEPDGHRHLLARRGLCDLDVGNDAARPGMDPLDREDVTLGLADDHDRSRTRPSAHRRIDQEPVTGLDRRAHARLGDADAPRPTEPIEHADPRPSNASERVGAGLWSGRAAGDQAVWRTTRVFSGPPVAFQAAATSSMRSRSFFASARSVDAFTFEACFVACQNRSWRLGTVPTCSGLK